jgi:hypothetical protein
VLVGTDPGGELTAAVPRIEALARACECGGVERVASALVPVLGRGSGLTPSGDDFAGGLLFGRRCLARAKGAPLAVGRVVRRTLAHTKGRCSAISAGLLSDLASGHAHAPFHELADALGAREGTLDPAIRAARRLVAIGHSPGWSMLAGFFTAVLGREALA